MDYSLIVHIATLCFLVAIISAWSTYIYIARTDVGKAMRAEIAKKYGTRNMRQFMGKPHPDVPDQIVAISPRFARIYEQASYAEQDGYDEVCGVGYGKALEVLIKDYASACHPEEVEEIRKNSLAVCIKKYIDDESLRNSTDLARWLRNDETHYQRSFTEHGAPELRGLIGITMLLIEQAAFRRATDARLDVLRKSMEVDQKMSKT
jgi:hypothetical protein